jgi:hypothetical protein
MQGSGETDRVGTRRSRKVGLMLLAAGALVVGAFAVWLSPAGNGGFGQGVELVRTETGNPGAIGTSGQDSGLPAAGVIHDLETITGSNDGHELVGRRVELHAPVSQHINDVTFWVGMGDNRVLVVLARDSRDNRDGRERQASNAGIGELHAGQQAAISGSIRRVPEAEAMYSWGLTDADRAELMERRIYLRADHVTPGI